MLFMLAMILANMGKAVIDMAPFVVFLASCLDELRALLGLGTGAVRVVVAGSTSAGEEEQVLDAFERLGVFQVFTSTWFSAGLRIYDISDPFRPEEISAQFAAAQTIDATGQVVLPGLINTHTHAPMVLYRGLADDLEVVLVADDHREARADELLVVDDQNPLRHAAPLGSLVAPCCRTSPCDRQGERERRSAADLALDPDPPAVQLHDPLRERQAEPRALALARVVRPHLAELLEDQLVILLVDSDAVIDHADLDRNRPLGHDRRGDQRSLRPGGRRLRPVAGATRETAR